MPPRLHRLRRRHILVGFAKLLIGLVHDPVGDGLSELGIG